MNTATSWLPRPTPKQRFDFLRELIRKSPQTPVAYLSEFLTSDAIRFLPGGMSKIQVAEHLAGALPGHDKQQILQAVWTREREGSLVIPPDVSILRGRLERVHHLRAAMGLCPEGVIDPSNPHGMTQLFILFVGPTTQTHLHMAFLVSLASLFRNWRLMRRVMELKSPVRVLKAIRQAEGLEPCDNFYHRGTKAIRRFFGLHYGWGEVDLL